MTTATILTALVGGSAFIVITAARKINRAFDRILTEALEDAFRSEV